MTTLTVGEGRYAGLTEAALQRAADDAAAAGGGTVVVPAGVYLMRNALRLPSGVRVVGRPGAVLKKVPSVQSRIPDFLGYGHYEVTVEEPDKFPVGTGVHVLDDKAFGFYTTVATVVGRDGDRLFLDRMLNHDYHVRQNARVVSVFPLVEASGAAGSAVEDLVLDGSADEETFTLNGCRGGGVFLIRSARVALRGLEVRNYRGDGVSFQQCTDVLISRCHVHHNTGHGLHPGSGSVRYVLEDCRVRDNGADGIYYCLRTTHSVCRRNEIAANGRSGISVGERDTDHLIAENRIEGHPAGAVVFRGPVRTGGERTVVRGNRIGPGGAASRGAQVAVAEGLRDVYVLDNVFSDEAGPALSVGPRCRGVVFAGNRVGDREQAARDVTGAGEAVTLACPAAVPAVGPGGCPPQGARHLNVATLPPWDEATMWPGGG